jgi:hypothetical protein
MAAPTFREGVDAAEEAGARRKFGRSVGYFGIDDGKFLDGRFLSDGVSIDHGLLRKWITAKQHNRQPTRPAPSNLKEGQKWPKEMGGVCRHDKAFATMYTDCYICDHYNVESGKVNKAKDRTWGLMLVRTPTLDATGKLVGMEDVLEDVTITEDGKERTIQRPKIVVINQAWSTFWSHYSPYLDMNGTVLDRDYRIFRKGSELDTDYPPAPFDPALFTYTNAAGQPVTEPLDFRNKAHFDAYTAKYGEGWCPDLGEIVADKASDDFYARFFDPTKPFPVREGESDSGPVTSKPAANEPTDEELAALAARVQGQPIPPQATPGPVPAPEPQPASVGPAGPSIPA